jgi:hypothetical protein
VTALLGVLRELKRKKGKEEGKEEGKERIFTLFLLL